MEQETQILVESNEPNETKQKSRKETVEWLSTLVVSILVVVLLFTFCFRMVGISGSSMEDTLQSQDRVIIRSAFYTPKAGDIVVLSRDYITEEDGTSPEPIIKRIIATEGQEVYLDFANNKVVVDGVALEEPYVKGVLNEGRVPIQNPHVVKEGCVFVLGDHRTVSKDSRTAEVGDVDTRYILGEAMVRIFPFTDMKGLWNE
ncbi:MAG: signal peptidase I [Clostridia bacterium]|nr:signal peptidase I [Clostridia bacterium]